MSDSPSSAAVSLASCVVGLVPRQSCLFQMDSSRSLHAALLRRLERLDPRLSTALHAAPEGAHGVERPWAVSGLAGELDATAEGVIARPGSICWARVTGLTASMCAALQSILRPAEHGTALELEHVPFDLAEVDGSVAQTWSRATTYAALLAEARPRREIRLAWLSPTGFRRGQGHAAMPEPRLCLASYLRRWNAFAGDDCKLPEEPLLAYASERLRVVEVSLRQEPARFGRFQVPGQVGHVIWRCQDGTESLIRQINALADYAFFCGTGVKTAMGMGQTVRLTRAG